MYLLITLILAIISYLLSNFCKKNKYMTSLSGDKHQEFTNNQSVPLIGGFFILIGFFFIFYDQNIHFLIVLTTIFFLGLFSDLKIVISPNIRILIQFIIVLYLIYFLKMEIGLTRISIVDNFLDNKIINILFVCFCLMVLINGTNFIDGLNGLSLGYYLLIFLALISNELNFSNFLQNKELVYISCFLFVFLILNFCNLFFIGDNGAYVLSLATGFLLINIYKENPYISPYFIILLLWYPCFELLFSMIRKFDSKYSPISPDSYHLHQLMFYLINDRFSLSQLKSNNISAFVILFFNSISIYCGSLKNSNTGILILLIIFNILIYSITYNLLLKYRNSNKTVF